MRNKKNLHKNLYLIYKKESISDCHLRCWEQTAWRKGNAFFNSSESQLLCSSPNVSLGAACTCSRLLCLWNHLSSKLLLTFFVCELVRLPAKCLRGIHAYMTPLPPCSHGNRAVKEHAEEYERRLRPHGHIVTETELMLSFWEKTAIR